MSGYSHSKYLKKCTTYKLFSSQNRHRNHVKSELVKTIQPGMLLNFRRANNTRLAARVFSRFFPNLATSRVFRSQHRNTEIHFVLLNFNLLLDFSGNQRNTSFWVTSLLLLNSCAWLWRMANKPQCFVIPYQALNVITWHRFLLFNMGSVRDSL